MTPHDVRPLQRTLSTPLWLQLKHALRDSITFDGQPGDRIPTEAELCEHYGLSRVTVRQAITSLVDEGLLVRRQGKGTFVSDGRLAEVLAEQDHVLLGGFDAHPRHDISVHSVETVPVPEWIAARLRLEPDGPVFKVRKVLTTRGEIVAFRTTYVPVAAVPDLLVADLSAPFALTFESQFGLRLASAEETIEFIIADEFRAGMLGVPVNHPLILVERVVGLDTGQAVECSRTFYKADRFRFRRHLARAPGGAGEGASRAVEGR